MAAGPITTGSWSLDLLPGVQKFVGMDYPDWMPLYDKMFEVEKTKERYSVDAMSAMFGLPQVKPEGSAIHYDSSNMTWTQRYEQVVYSLGFQITREMIDDSHSLKPVQDNVRAAKKSFMQGRDIVCTQFLNNAFTALGGDGVSFISTAHPTQSGGTYSNTLSVAADINEASLETLTTLARTLIDERGIIMNAQPRKLIIHPTNHFEVSRILNSALRVHTTDNDINVLKADGIFKEVIKNPFLTNPQAYFITTDVPKGLRYIERDGLEVSNEPSFDTDTARYKLRMRFVVGGTDPRGLIGVNGP